MKKALVPVAILLTLITLSSFMWADRPADDVRKLDAFVGIGISVHAEVFYTPGNSHEIRIEGNERDVNDLITEVKNGFLKIKYENYRMKRSKVILHITSRELEAVKNSGSSRFTAEKAINSEEMDLAISGSGSIRFPELNAEEVEVRISGSGNIELDKGKADEIGVKISGSGKLNAEKFQVSEFSAALSGSGSCRITVEDELEAKLSGSGKIYYHGDPRVNSVSSGSGKVIEL